MNADLWLLIVLAGVLTYITRFAGHLLLSRLGTIPPRLDAALNAVPPAMLITIVVPAFVDGGWVERLVIVGSGILALRISVLNSVIIGVGAIALLRALGA
ncbi:AzlD family protein [Aureimonas mangrovi]|uniref:AzlD family protein n=1 Tax=Aureimonas mangrovi TaxID=2758041 RepID=UPI001FE34F1D|nr:AzlD domain-containing protein [Aureimonas mangrovi]